MKKYSHLLTRDMVLTKATAFLTGYPIFNSILYVLKTLQMHPRSLQIQRDITLRREMTSSFAAFLMADLNLK